MTAPASPTSPAGSPARTLTPCPRCGSPTPATAWAARLSGTPWRRNGDIPRHELARTHPPADDGQAVIDHAIDLGLIGNLGAHHITAVAWTLTDLAGRSRPGAAECAQALAFWTGAAR